MRTKKSRRRLASDVNDPRVVTKRWLRSVLKQAITYWASVMKLESIVDEITFYITEDDDPGMDIDAGAEVLVASSTRTATIKFKRGVVRKFAGEYQGQFSPENVAEMTVLHELCHIITHPMSKWTHSTIESMRNKGALEKHFVELEEAAVEHLTRVFFSMKESIPSAKFKGKVGYLIKDPFKE